MIAEVYPLIRLPRTKRVFDYKIPENTSLTRGSFVQIPYRNKTIWGVVHQVKDKPPRGIELKTILGVSEQIQLREEELSFFEGLAKDLVQSPASVLYAAFPTQPKRTSPSKSGALSWLPLTLPRTEAEHVVRIVQTLSLRGKAFVQAPDLRRSAAIILGYLQKNTGQKILILVPTVNDVKRLRGHITGSHPYVISGSETNNERFRAWKEFRDQDEGILIGTRTALLTIDSSIDSIFVLRSGDKNYKQDRNPRYDARELAWKHHHNFSSRLFYFDASPQAHTLAYFDETERLTWGSYPDIEIANLNQERYVSPTRVVSYTAGKSIADALERGERVLCVYNKKGSGSDLRCGDCSHRFTCPSCKTPLSAFSHTLECARCRHKEPLALHCPSCRGTKLKPWNPGNREVANELSQLFPGARVQILDKEHPDYFDAHITLTTTYFFETHVDPFRPERFGSVVLLNVDTPLYESKPSAVDDLMRDIWQWSWLGFSSKASVVIQTSSHELVRSCIEQPFKTAKEELHAKYTYNLPPYYRWYKVTYKEKERRKAEIAVQKLSESLSKVPDSEVLPISWTREGFAEVECGIPEQKRALFLNIFSSLPDRYIIDTNAFS